MEHANGFGGDLFPFAAEKAKFDRLERIFFLQPRVKILIVTDGSAGFGKSPGGPFVLDDDFSLGEVLNELANDPWWWVRFQVTTAHRRNDPFAAATATYKNFRFDSPPVPLSTFDEIWLFGVEGRADPLSPPPASSTVLQSAEIDALRGFMDAGGGIFATGDHYGLGESMCAQLPRVGKMRRWQPGGPVGTPPPPTGPNRYDTVREGPTPGYEFNDQSDNVPQPIYPTRYYNPWDLTIFTQHWRPHPVLCGRHGVIDVLPDHMHENRIVQTATALAAGSAGEWPGGQGPEVIATARVIPHTNIDGFGFVSGPPAEEGLPAGEFGVLGAYEGHPQGVGRIVVDATWHHWFHVNVRGFNPASPEYDKIRNYWWNVALWLAPPAKQQAMYHAAVYGLTYLQPFNELYVDPPTYWLGFAAVDAIGRRASQCLVTEWVIPKLLKDFAVELRWKPIPPDPGPLVPVFGGLEHIREFALGGAIKEMLRVFRNEDLTEPPSEEQLQRIVERGSIIGLTELLEHQQQEAERTARTMKLLEDQLSQVQEAQPVG
jgi:hypothetical protein